MAVTFQFPSSVSVSNIGSTAVLGAELISDPANRDFSGPGNWSGTGWSVSGGQLVRGVGGGAATLANSYISSAPGGLWYLASITITTTTVASSTITVTLGGVAYIGNTHTGLRVGTVTLTAAAFPSSSPVFAVNADSSWAGSIDNVSVKQITQAEPLAKFISSSGPTLSADVRNVGSNSVYFGRDCGLVSATSSNVVGVGALALQRTVNGVNVTAIGSSALRYAAVATNSAAFGTSALMSCNGSCNTAAGASCLQTVGYGSYNSGHGYSALSGLRETDSYCTAIGAEAGKTAQGSGHVFIGYSAGRYEVGDNAFYVNNQDRTDTASEKTKSLLYGTFNADENLQTLRANAAFTALRSIRTEDPADATDVTGLTGGLGTLGGLSVAKSGRFGGTVYLPGGTAGTVGPELITLQADRDFSAANNWVPGTGWTTTGGAATKVATANISVLDLPTSAISGYSSSDYYLVSFKITTTSPDTTTPSGSTSGFIGTSVAGLQKQYLYLTEVGTVNFSTVIQGSSFQYVSIGMAAEWAGTITNVSIKKVSPATSGIQIGGSPYFTNSTYGIGAGYLGGYFSQGTTNTTYGGVAGNRLLYGNNNVLLGTYAGQDVCLGSHNTITGVSAGRSVSTGSRNTLYGYGAGSVIQFGSDNAIFGASTGVFMSGFSSRNTLMGNFSGYQARGSGHVFLGYNAGRYETGNDAFYLNNQDRTNTAGDKAKSLLYGTFNADENLQTLRANAAFSSQSVTSGPAYSTLLGTVSAWGANPNSTHVFTATQNQGGTGYISAFSSFSELLATDVNSAYVVGSSNVAVASRDSSYIWGSQSAAIIKAGNSGQVIGFVVGANNQGSGTITELIGIKAGAANYGYGATITSMYGLYLEDIGGATNNYSIYAGTGIARFGDTTDSTTGDGLTGAVRSLGGASFAKSIRSGGKIAASYTVSSGLNNYALDITATQPSDVSSGSLYAARAQAVSYSTSALGQLEAGYFSATASAASGTVTSVVGVLASAGFNGSGTGTVTNAYGIFGIINPGFSTTTTVTNAYGAYISALSSDKISNSYGIYIGSVSGGTVSNYSLYAGTGIARFGDTTDATTGDGLTGAFRLLGGLSAAQSIRSGTTLAAGGAASPVIISEGPIQGISNIAVGYLALSSWSYGSTGQNVAVGYHAMKNATSGFRNAAFGHYSMRENLTGVDNCAVGWKSMSGNTESNQCVAIGYQAHMRLRGDYNVAVGYAAGGQLATAKSGSNNTFVGAYAGGRADGSGNVYIGYYAGNNLGDYGTVNNVLVIDNQQRAAIGSPSEPTTSLIYGTFNATAALQTLRINGSLSVLSSLTLDSVSEYADNAAAVTAGLPVGRLYRTGDVLKIVHA